MPWCLREKGLLAEDQAVSGVLCGQQRGHSTPIHHACGKRHHIRRFGVLIEFPGKPAICEKINYDNSHERAVALHARTREQGLSLPEIEHASVQMTRIYGAIFTSAGTRGIIRDAIEFWEELPLIR